MLAGKIALENGGCMPPLVDLIEFVNERRQGVERH